MEGIDSGAAFYDEQYAEDAGPIAGTGTGWKVPEPEEIDDGEESESSGEAEK